MKVSLDSKAKKLKTPLPQRNRWILPCDACAWCFFCLAFSDFHLPYICSCRSCRICLHCLSMQSIKKRGNWHGELPVYFCQFSDVGDVLSLLVHSATSCKLTHFRNCPQRNHIETCKLMILPLFTKKNSILPFSIDPFFKCPSFKFQSCTLPQN